MEALDKPRIKATIEREIEKTKKLIAEYKELTKPVEPENSIGRISRMDAINNKSVTEAALRKAKEKLENLKFALNKLEDCDFGICIRCKKSIPLQRILIRPQSRSCVACSR